MPGLFCLGLHNAFKEANDQFLPGESIVAYPNDIYLVTEADRTLAVYEIENQAIHNHTKVQSNFGKTECWSKAGDGTPPGLDVLNAPSPVWKGNLRSDKNGIEVLGSPLGNPTYIKYLFAGPFGRRRGIR